VNGYFLNSLCLLVSSGLQQSSAILPTSSLDLPRSSPTTINSTTQQPPSQRQHPHLAFKMPSTWDAKADKDLLLSIIDDGQLKSINWPSISSKMKAKNYTFSNEACRYVFFILKSSINLSLLFLCAPFTSCRCRTSCLPVESSPLVETPIRQILFLSKLEFLSSRFCHGRHQQTVESEIRLKQHFRSHPLL